MSKEVQGRYRVVGPNSADGQFSEWYFGTLELAKEFAVVMVGETGGEYYLYEVIGVMRPVPRPAEFVEAAK